MILITKRVKLSGSIKERERHFTLYNRVKCETLTSSCLFFPFANTSSIFQSSRFLFPYPMSFLNFYSLHLDFFTVLVYNQSSRSLCASPCESSAGVQNSHLLSSTTMGKCLPSEVLFLFIIWKLIPGLCWPGVKWISSEETLSDSHKGQR